MLSILRWDTVVVGSLFVVAPIHCVCGGYVACSGFAMVAVLKFLSNMSLQTICLIGGRHQGSMKVQDLQNHFVSDIQDVQTSSPKPYNRANRNLLGSIMEI